MIKLKETTAKQVKKREEGSRISDSQKQEIDEMLIEFPKLQRKVEKMIKGQEGANMISIQDQIQELSM